MIPVRSNTRRFARWPLAVCLGLVLLAKAVPADPGETNAAPAERELRVAFSAQIFREMSPADGLAAAKVWLQSLTKNGPISEHPRVFLIDGFPELEKAMRDHAFDVVVLLSMDYLKLEPSGDLIPWFTYRRGSTNWEEQVLITRKDGPAALAQLRGKRLTVYGGEQAEIGKLWLDTQLLQQDQPPLTDFFSSITVNSKPIKVVLPVFFGQADACVINRDAFEVMGELNPQVREKLAVRAVSQPMLAVALCGHRRSDPEVLSRLHLAFATAQDDPQIRQVFANYGIRRFDPIDIHSFDNLRRLIRQHDELSRQKTDHPNTALLTKPAAGRGSNLKPADGQP